VRPGAAKRLLKEDAVPSGFPAFPQYLQKPSASRKPPAKRARLDMDSASVNVILRALAQAMKPTSRVSATIICLLQDLVHHKAGLMLMCIVRKL
jgi:hypothetical protein